MNESQAKRWVIATAVILYGSGILRTIVTEKKLPERTFWVGATLVMFVLAFASDIRPREAGPFSAMVMVAAIMANSIPILDQLEAISNPPSPVGGIDPKTGNKILTPIPRDTRGFLPPLTGPGGGRPLAPIPPDIRIPQ